MLKGSLLCVVGDTPAVALVGGFKEGVGFAEKKCRHCLANNQQIQNYVSEYGLCAHNVLTLTCVHNTYVCACIVYVYYKIIILLVY